MKHDPIAVARASYRAYVDKDRAAIEALIAADFHFTSPLDNRIDRATYFRPLLAEQCEHRGVRIHIVPDDDRVFVTYEGRSTSGKRFRNAKS